MIIRLLLGDSAAYIEQNNDNIRCQKKVCQAILTPPRYKGRSDVGYMMNFTRKIHKKIEIVHYFSKKIRIFSVKICVIQKNVVFLPRFFENT